MKTKNLSLVLVLVLAASLSVLAQTACDGVWDCYPLWDDYDVFCYGNQGFFNASGDFYDCNMTTGYCQFSTGRYPWGDFGGYNCSKYNNRACKNGDLYKISFDCYPYTGDFECELISAPTFDVPNSPTCLPSIACPGEAHTLATPKADIDYNPDFYGEYTLDTDGTYVVVPGTAAYIDDIEFIEYYCGNGVAVPRTPNLIVWIYNETSNDRIAIARNNIEINSNLKREDVIGPGSTTNGTPVLNPWEMLYQYGMENEEINPVYTFNNPGRYIEFIDLISSYCSPNEMAYNTTPNYVCPWLGGTNRANLCSYKGVNVEGWTDMENLSVLVPNPEISIDAPTNEPNLNVTTIQKTWNLSNTGVGRSVMNITYDCGNWTCAFDGYNGNPIPLEEKEAYTPGITLNITALPGELNHPVGIVVAYDEGYGLASMPPDNTSSYISISTMNAVGPWLSVVLNQPANGSTVPNNVTLNYTIIGSNSTYNVSLNLNGDADNQTDTGKLNDTLSNFTLVDLAAGEYSWNVAAYINSTFYAVSETRTFTVTTNAIGLSYIT